MLAGAAASYQWRQDRTRPELVFGLIGAIGAKISDVESALRDRLEKLHYHVPETIKLSALLPDLNGAVFQKLRAENGTAKAPIAAFMDAGNSLRATTGRSDAMALLGVNKIRSVRNELGVPEDVSADGVAFIVDSLKHPFEVRALRQLYGSSFVAVAVFNNREERLESTQHRLQKYHNRGEASAYREEAEKLVERDENEQNVPHGQHVSEAFALADVVIGKSQQREFAKKRDLQQSVVRFIDLFFGDWRYTPTLDETGMYYAQGARYRSASMARQVGAAILRPDGTVIATGTNDVPSPGGGGLYGDHHETDGRDHAQPSPRDTSDFYKREVLLDLLEEMSKLGRLGIDDANKIQPLVDHLIESKALKNTRFMATIDYVRAVHAEMAAIMDAARHGIGIANATLYTTTFPCHDCSKHIVAAGIERVIFVEPYTKSLTSELFSDSIAIDAPAESGKVHFSPFIGVMPRRYADLFAMHGERKTVKGMWKEWKPEEARPVLGDYIPPSGARIMSEDVSLQSFTGVLEANDLIRTSSAG